MFSVREPFSLCSTASSHSGLRLQQVVVRSGAVFANVPLTTVGHSLRSCPSNTVPSSKTVYVGSSKQSIFLFLATLSLLVEKAENLAGNVSSSGLLVVHDSGRGGQNDVAKLSRGQQVLDPLLHVVNLDVESRRDDSTLVESAVELDHNLSGSVVVHVLKLANVAVLLHHGEKLDDHLGRGSDQDLSLAGLLGVGDGLESVSENGGSGHFGGGVKMGVFCAA